MDHRIGKRLKAYALFTGWTSFVLSIIVALAAAIYLGKVFDSLPYLLWVQLSIIAIGVIVGVLGYFRSWLLYSFGQIVDDLHSTRNAVNDLADFICKDTSEE